IHIVTDYIHRALTRQHDKLVKFYTLAHKEKNMIKPIIHTPNIAAQKENIIKGLIVRQQDMIVKGANFFPEPE
ncbi:MAG: hypothetical protein VX695_03170, partial [Chloroflexota bacterium]|nr:hypothetical protein [Chloroflexota bacterium]